MTEEESLLKELDSEIWEPEGPIVFSVSKNQDQFFEAHLFPHIDNHQWNKQFMVISPKEETGFVESLKNAVSESFGIDDSNLLKSDNPDDWSSAIQKSISREKKHIERFGWNGVHVFLVESFDEIYSRPIDEQIVFTSLLSHISCERGVSVLIAVEDFEKLGSFPALEFASRGKSNIRTVPTRWTPPQSASQGPIHQPDPKPEQSSEKETDSFLGNAVVFFVFSLGVSALMAYSNFTSGVGAWVTLSISSTMFLIAFFFSANRMVSLIRSLQGIES